MLPSKKDYLIRIIHTGVPRTSVDMLVRAAEWAMGFRTWSEETSHGIHQILVDKGARLDDWRDIRKGRSPS